MKNNALSLLFAVSVLPLFSFDKDRLLYQPMPLIPGQTLDGKTVDAAYYKGHLTLVSFMYIGCPPCMNEIGALNRLKKDFGSDKRFRILCVARQMRSQMLSFIANDTKYLSQFRKGLGVDSIQYDILPVCPEAESKMERTVTIKKTGKDTDTSININLKSECDVLERLLGIDSFPTLLFVDGAGIVRKANHGGPISNNDDGFYRMLRQDVAAALRY